MLVQKGKPLELVWAFLRTADVFLSRQAFILRKKATTVECYIFVLGSVETFSCAAYCCIATADKIRHGPVFLQHQPQQCLPQNFMLTH